MKIQTFFRTIIAALLLIVISASCSSRTDDPETPKEPFKISQDKLEISIGQTKSVVLENGSGTYKITNPDESLAKVTIQEHKIFVEALNVGELELSVTDTKSHETITLHVTIREAFGASETAIEMKVGKTTVISLLNGSGKYRIENQDEKVVDISIKDSDLTIKALLAGKTSVKVTDEKSEESITVSITVGEPFGAKETEVTIKQGEQKIITLENGSGEYELTNSNGNIAEASIKNNTVILNALTVGKTEINITDTKTDEQISIIITVRAPLRLSEEAIEMNVGDETSITILNGSGKYDLSYSKENLLTTQLIENTLTIKALAKGDVDISITDTETMDKVTLSISISDTPALPAGVKVVDGVIILWPAEDIPTSGIVIIPSDIIGIGEEAFAKGPIKELQVPSSVKKIGKNAFAYCNSLTRIELAEGLTEIGESAFYQCHKLSSMNLPSSIKVMGANAFAYCDMLKDIMISDGLTLIGESAFVGCNTLEQIDLPQSITFIGDNAFLECTKLTTITIPNGVTEIHQTTFKGCSALSTVILPNQLTSIGRYAFANCTSLSKIELPKSLLTINGQAFNGCSSLTKIEIPNNITEIQASTFENCSELKEVIFSEDSNISKIGIKAFQNCTSLTKIVIPEGVNEINNMAFRSCSGLTELDLPSTLGSIRLNSFLGCSELRKVISRATTPPNLLGNPFNKTPSDKILYTIDDTAKAAYESSTSWTKAFSNIEVLK